MKTVGTKLDLDTIKLLEEKAKKEGKNKNQILKELIVNYISDNAEGAQSVIATNQESKSDIHPAKLGNKESEPLAMKQETQAKKTIVKSSEKEKENKKAETGKIEKKVEKIEEEKKPRVSEVAVIPRESNKLFVEKEKIEEPRKQKSAIAKSKPKKKSFWESFFEDDWDIFDEFGDENKKLVDFKDNEENEEDGIDLLLFSLLAIGIICMGGLGGLGVKSVGIGWM